jgi:hypothetical protein
VGHILFVGDVQGCAAELHELLRVARFDRHRHRLALCGDLVNRGPDSAAVLRLVRDLDALTVIGNHEVALLEGRRTATLDEVRRQLGSTLDEWLACVYGGQLTGLWWPRLEWVSVPARRRYFEPA